MSVYHIATGPPSEEMLDVKPLLQLQLMQPPKLSSYYGKPDQPQEPETAAAEATVMTIKKEPVSDSSSVSSDIHQSPGEQPIEENKSDPDVYFKDFVKVEAIVGRRAIPQLLIPVDIPYTEPFNRRRKEAVKDPSVKVGRLKMRKISELQKPMPISVSVLSRRSSLTVPYSQSQCFCWQCLSRRSSRMRPPPDPNLRAPPAPANPPVIPPTIEKPRLWRPFI